MICTLIAEARRKPAGVPSTPGERGQHRRIHPRDTGEMPRQAPAEHGLDDPFRVPAGGGYRILRRPRLLDGEE